MPSPPPESTSSQSSSSMIATAHPVQTQHTGSFTTTTRFNQPQQHVLYTERAIHQHNQHALISPAFTRTCIPCRRKKRSGNGRIPCQRCGALALECTYPLPAGHSAAGSQSAVPRRLSSGSACETCRRRKTKCDGNIPCHFCLTNGLVCVNNSERWRQKETAARAEGTSASAGYHKSILSIPVTNNPEKSNKAGSSEKHTSVSISREPENLKRRHEVMMEGVSDIRSSEGTSQSPIPSKLSFPSSVAPEGTSGSTVSRPRYTPKSPPTKLTMHADPHVTPRPTLTQEQSANRCVDATISEAHSVHQQYSHPPPSERHWHFPSTAFRTWGTEPRRLQSSRYHLKNSDAEQSRILPTITGKDNSRAGQTSAQTMN
ncbi:hypothetical protein BZG36_03790 [Bifiguratus adelaidae]|uniref:Zn(2)-C6 fungal-type domain-containing protein n=1 Tax=Bifiguratus adelaidae TaxID=1938954 RepID=A0A261XWZ6_9FUNG|nr:hypothetical protein BZG36_03790 [Bifiguratus adelaidae]